MESDAFLIRGLEAFYTIPLRDLAPMGEVAMLAGRRDDGLVVLALFEKPENLVLILWFLSSDAN